MSTKPNWIRQPCSATTTDLTPTGHARAQEWGGAEAAEGRHRTPHRLRDFQRELFVLLHCGVIPQSRFRVALCRARFLQGSSYDRELLPVAALHVIFGLESLLKLFSHPPALLRHTMHLRLSPLHLRRGGLQDLRQSKLSLSELPRGLQVADFPVRIKGLQRQTYSQQETTSGSSARPIARRPSAGAGGRPVPPASPGRA